MTPDAPELTEAERDAFAKILDAMHAVTTLGGEGKSLPPNVLTELATAVHVLQGMVQQAVLARLMPHEFSNWWKRRDTDGTPIEGGALDEAAS